MNINNINYTILDYKEIISDDQAHIHTDKGIILVDTSMEFNNLKFNTIQEIINYLNQA